MRIASASIIFSKFQMRKNRPLKIYFRYSQHFSSLYTTLWIDGMVGNIFYYFCNHFYYKLWIYLSFPTQNKVKLRLKFFQSTCDEIKREGLRRMMR